MISANRSYTAQDIIELFNGGQPHVDQLIANALNTGADVGAIIKREIKQIEDAHEEIELRQYIESGEAARDRHLEAYEMQHDCY